VLKIISGEDIINHINEYDAIIISSNIYCALQIDGVQRDIALNYPYVREMNFTTRYGDINKLGTILECKVDNEPLIILAYIYKGYHNTKKKGERAITEFLSYESLEKCLKQINILYKGKNIACPLLGCTPFDGNGNKDRVIEIINNTLTDVDITIYDYQQKTRSEKLKEIYEYEKSIKKIDYDLYRKIVSERKLKAEERFKRNGFARY
jgi:hypothetical protein